MLLVNPRIEVLFFFILVKSKLNHCWCQESYLFYKKYFLKKHLHHILPYAKAPQLESIAQQGNQIC